MKTNIKAIFYTLKESSLYITSLYEDKIQMPGIDLEQLDPNKTIAGIPHILKKIHVEHTELSFNWTEYRFLEVELYNTIDSQLALDIYYCAFFPANIQLQKAYWINAEKLIPQYPILRKLLCLI